MPTRPFVRITPLGGMGEIGLNCQLWETAEGIVMLDCGLMFPSVEHLGIDIVIPDSHAIQSVRDRVRGIIVTHGHEDHIGALPWIVPILRSTTIYASPFTLSLIEHKLHEHDVLDRVTLIELAPYDMISLAGLTFHCIPVCHSIPQSYAFCIESPVGRIIHSGDFKIEYPEGSDSEYDTDPDVVFDEGTDLTALEDFARGGLRLLLSDSTNVTSEGFSLSERAVSDSLRNIFSQAPGRIIITLFSSHVRRMQEIFDLAVVFGRSVVISGRSIATNLDLAYDLDLVQYPPDFYNAHSGVPDLPDDKIVLLVTGAQGEPYSALSRMVFGGHKNLSIHAGDTVIMSSRMIPGNTRAIIRMINEMFHKGAEVFYESSLAVHASGHAHKEELSILLERTKPTYFVPMHGEFQHLVRHAQLAEKMGVEKDNVILLEDGCPLTLFADGFHLEERIPLARTLVDGKGVGDVEETVLRERRLLGDEGMVIVLLVFDLETGSVLYGPDILSKGFVSEQDYSHVLEDAQCIVLDEIELMGSNPSTQLQDNIRSAVRRFFRRVLDRDPVVVPVLLSV